MNIISIQKLKQVNNYDLYILCGKAFVFFGDDSRKKNYNKKTREFSATR